MGEEALRPAEEQSLHGYWDGDDRPDPLVAQSAPEFVAQLRALVQWSGLTLDEVEQLARANGDVLPPSIVSAALSHHTLPPEEVVVALVAAIGDDDDMVELWASVLWRLEESETAVSRMAPLSAPPPVSSMTGAASVAAVRQYSGGALADAIHKRRHQNSWTGLHRSFKKGLRATGFGSKYGRWPVPAAIGVTVFILVAGVAWAMASGGDGEKTAQQRSNPCCKAGAEGGARASGVPEGQVSPSGLPMVIPVPSTSTKPTNSPTPRQSPRNSPTPTQTQTQLNPSLDGNGNATCADSSGNWVVTLSVTAVLTGAPSGNNPQGRAGKPGDPRPFTLNGDGTTSFTGQATITIGASAEPASGSVEWNVSVTVTGAGSVPDSGTATYSCSAGT